MVNMLGRFTTKRGQVHHAVDDQTVSGEDPLDRAYEALQALDHGEVAEESASTQALVGIGYALVALAAAMRETNAHAAYREDYP